MAAHLPSLTNGVLKPGKNKSYTAKPVMETLTNGFFTVDQKWIVKYWNKAAEKLLKVQAKDIIGKNLWDTFAGSFPLEFYAVYHKAFLKNTPVHFEEYWGEMGAWFDVITYYSDNTLSVSFKSSNHPHAEYPESPVQRMATLAELYRFVTEITNDCLWEWDLANKEIFWIDGGHKRVFDYHIENALIPQSFWENCIHPEDKDRILASLNKIISGGSEFMWEVEYRFKKANGDYAYVHDRGHIVYDDDNIASRMIGATQDISERVLLENKLIQEKETKQREITAAVLVAQEKERSQIAGELHDNLNQTLAVVKMYIQMAKKQQSNWDTYLEKSSSYLENVIGDIRKIAKNLVIPGTHIIGLFDNIKNLLHDLREVNPIQIRFLYKGFNQEDLDEKLQLTIYRIVQEQLNNILKHADATKAYIRLNRRQNEIILRISDNGKGSDISRRNGGVGIINIKSRASLHNGIASVTSAPGRGYELNVVLPLER